jgi:hypothetical protein
LCAPFWGVQICDRCVFSKPFTKLTLHCNHRSGHLKTEHTVSLFRCEAILETGPSAPQFIQSFIHFIVHIVTYVAFGFGHRIMYNCCIYIQSLRL